MLPINWQIDFGYYITYFGEVYYGIAIIKDFNKGDFYIVGKNKWVEYSKEQDRVIPQEDLEKFGIYISTKEIIEHWRKEIPASRDDYNVNWNGLASDYKKMYIFSAGASANCLFSRRCWCFSPTASRFLSFQSLTHLVFRLRRRAGAVGRKDTTAAIRRSRWSKIPAFAGSLSVR